jgi:hypothetical protein
LIIDERFYGKINLTFAEKYNRAVLKTTSDFTGLDAEWLKFKLLPGLGAAGRIFDVLSVK